MGFLIGAWMNACIFKAFIINVHTLLLRKGVKKMFYVQNLRGTLSNWVI